MNKKKVYKSSRINDLKYKKNNLETYGNLTWNFLHKTSLNYPIFPSNKHKEDMEKLLKSVATFFPCIICGNHWKKILENSDMESILSNRNNLMLWLCNKHNEINIKIGKEVFPCEIDKLFERWN